VTDVARLLRRLLPAVAAAAVAVATALPALAAVTTTAGMTTTGTTTTPVDKAGEWWLTALHAAAAQQEASTAGNGVTVAVLSTGVDASHPDLTGNVVTGPDLAETGRKAGGAYWGDEGTAVASLIAGHGHGPGRSAGITGIAPKARILSVPVTLEYDDPLNSDTAITRPIPDAIAAGIRYAVGHGASVIALPLDPGTLGASADGDPATAGGSAAEQSAVSYALAHDVLLIAPAGDNGAGANSVNYPAAYRGVIAVGATGRDGRLAVFSSGHSYVALTAPGAGVASNAPAAGETPADPAAGLTVAAPDGGYQPLASTDMSAALTAGVAALIRSRYPWLTVAEVTQAIERGVTPAPGRAARAAAIGSGHGELDAAAAVNAAAALAAAHPAPATPAKQASSASAPTAAAPAASGLATPKAASQDDGGRLLLSLVRYLAIVACALIACLIGALVTARLRRRARGATPAPPSATAPPGRVGRRRARHARGRRGVPLAPFRQGPPPWEADEAVTPSRPRRRTGKPPWPPARAPEGPLTPMAVPSTLPPGAQRPRSEDPPLAPWERSPAEFSAAPVYQDATPWPVSNTGPMYVWNPAATTAPLNVLRPEETSG
jgi:subtilisin family serine protease